MSTIRFLLPLALLCACAGGPLTETSASGTESDTDTDTDTDTTTDGTSTTLTTGFTTTTATQGSSSDPTGNPTSEGTMTTSGTESTSTTGVDDPCDPDPCDHPEPTCDGNMVVGTDVACQANGEDYECVETPVMDDCLALDPVQACLEGACSAPPPPIEGEVIFVEMMQNPEGLADEDAEWVELKNLGTLPVDLNGCHLADPNTDDHTINAGGPLVIKPGELMVLAKSADPMVNGGIEGVAYGYGAEFSLNDTSDAAILRCDIDIDTVQYEADGWPFGPGKAMGLDTTMEDAMMNDFAAAWCATKEEYAQMNTGTPGLPNSACI
ncbi:MAG: lamin tail domain-containing protein [Nannocystaceae bacterium]